MNTLTKSLLLLTAFSLLLGLFFILRSGAFDSAFLSPGGGGEPQLPKEKPLEKFTFDNLSVRTYEGSEITVSEEVYKEGDGFESRLFTFISDGKKVSGLINFPVTPSSTKKPVIVMLRGYVDRNIYQPGVGTSRAGEVFAKNGYITIAPDFLGYGTSDMPVNDVWWERFNNPVIVLNLLASIKNLPQADPDKIGIWAHSNGGQIALSVLEISRREIPTTLWAPVTKPFPFAILAFTDEFDDEGKALRKEIARLETDYDVRKYSICDYFYRITAPVQLHQGTSDNEVPLWWSEDFVGAMKKLDKDVEFFIHEGADHNMSGGWNQAVTQDLKFFAKHLNK